MRIALLVISSLIFVNCNNSSFTSLGSYQETKMTLEEKEKANPAIFLEATGTYRQNLIAQWVLEGQIKNKASVATYKDVVLKIVYYSKTQSEIGSEKKIIYEYFPANGVKNFKIKTNGFPGTKAIGFTVVTASASQ